MPKSKNKRKNGKTMDGTYKKHSRLDKMRINSSYLKKITEFEAMTLEELEELGTVQKLGGSYKMAYIQVLTRKRLKNPLAKENT